jgi:hypothetical protein
LLAQEVTKGAKFNVVGFVHVSRRTATDRKRRRSNARTGVPVGGFDEWSFWRHRGREGDCNRGGQ